MWGLIIFRGAPVLTYTAGYVFRGLPGAILVTFILQRQVTVIPWRPVLWVTLDHTFSVEECAAASMGTRADQVAVHRPQQLTTRIGWNNRSGQVRWSKCLTTVQKHIKPWFHIAYSVTSTTTDNYVGLQYWRGGKMEKWCILNQGERTKFDRFVDPNILCASRLVHLVLRIYRISLFLLLLT